MKNVLVICMLLFTIGTYAQKNDEQKMEARKEMREKMKDFTPEQMADLRTKQLALRLDLNESQQREIKTIEIERAKKMKAHMANKTEKKELTSDEMYQKRSQMLEDQLAVKNKMKSILTEEQYQKWEKGHMRNSGREHPKGNRMHPEKKQ